jgi:hypothetical protein
MPGTLCSTQLLEGFLSIHRDLHAADHGAFARLEMPESRWRTSHA